MKAETFNQFWTEHTPYLIELLKILQSEIDDDYRAYEDDEQPGMQITISMNKAGTTWSYQTGDNSFTGSCYGDPSWGVGAIYRDCDPVAVAKTLIDDLANNVQFEE